MFRLGKQTYCLITNSGVEGGAVLFDVARRKRVQYYDTPPGLETPVFLTKLSKAFAVCPGKRKERIVDQVIKEYFPRRQLFVFDFASGKEPYAMKTRNYEHFLFQLGLIHRENKLPLFAISIGDEASAANRIMIVDPQTQKTLDRQSSIGNVVQFSHP